jgi:hypothetical protein
MCFGLQSTESALSPPSLTARTRSSTTTSSPSKAPLGSAASAASADARFQGASAQHSQAQPLPLRTTHTVKFAPSQQLNLLSLIKTKQRAIPPVLHAQALKQATLNFPLFSCMCGQAIACVV